MVRPVHDVAKTIMIVWALGIITQVIANNQQWVSYLSSSFVKRKYAGDSRNFLSKARLNLDSDTHSTPLLYRPIL